MTTSLFNCKSDDSDDVMQDATLMGRWNLVGFEDTIRYEFTENKRYSIYSTDGKTFPTLNEVLLEQPNFMGLDWYYEGENVVIDLNFGNFSITTPEFKCSNNVIEFTNDDGELGQILFREGFDYNSCK